MNFMEQILLREPDEVGEASGNKFVGVGDLELEPGAGRRVGISKSNAAECSTLAELSRGFLEIVFVGDGADRQSTGGRDFFRCEVLAAGYFDCDELVRDWGLGFGCGGCGVAAGWV